MSFYTLKDKLLHIKHDISWFKYHWLCKLIYDCDWHYSIYSDLRGKVDGFK